MGRFLCLWISVQAHNLCGHGMPILRKRPTIPLRATRRAGEARPTHYPECLKSLALLPFFRIFLVRLAQQKVLGERGHVARFSRPSDRAVAQSRSGKYQTFYKKPSIFIEIDPQSLSSSSSHFSSSTSPPPPPTPTSTGQTPAWAARSTSATRDSLADHDQRSLG